MNNASAANENDQERCGYKMGALPSCAPLATSWVPPQKSAEPRYEAADGLSRGTLFPGLDLPFMNTVNRTHPYAGTPMGEVMALKFMIKELQLYLDTHSDDKEAFQLLKETIKLSNEAQRRYVRRYGALEIRDLEDMDSYDWICDPWPWQFREREDRD